MLITIREHKQGDGSITRDINISDCDGNNLVLHATGSDFLDVYEVALNLKKIIECNTIETVDVQETAVRNF